MSNLNINPKIWLKELYEHSYCEECGGDVKHHDAVPFNNNWFARCKYSPNNNGNLHPIIKKFRKKEGTFDK